MRRTKFGLPSYSECRGISNLHDRWWLPGRMAPAPELPVLRNRAAEKFVYETPIQPPSVHKLWFCLRRSISAGRHPQKALRRIVLHQFPRILRGPTPARSRGVQHDGRTPRIARENDRNRNAGTRGGG